MIFASDLDHTLVHPVRRLATGHPESISVVEWLDGRALSYMPTTALVSLQALASEHTFIPVTSRSRAQFERIAPISALCRGGTVICANGATVLTRGVVDVEWGAHVAARLETSASLDEASSTLTREFGGASAQGWLLRTHTCDDMYWYAVCDAARMPSDVVERARRLLDPLGWSAMGHGRKVYALPRGLTKEAALRYVVEALDDGPLVCAGDSSLDQGFLELADVALAPAESPAASGMTGRPVRAIHGSPSQATDTLLAIALAAAHMQPGLDTAWVEDDGEAAA
jgi:hydroxymethylpyrimidine pyrophosphatase-like HAD family hydrolase